ncbi:MAG: rhomboid family intramembrane serine protease [Chitinophagaceae bacterium]|jgi:membrane associated rhomboid family serine protease|nr:rhomboid family intramembrane serine protease [Flavisolibacter sp.]
MAEFKFTRPNSFPPIVKNLIIINVLVFLGQLSLTQFQFTERIMLYPVKHPEFAPYQVATHMFAHAPNMLFHILFNMFALWMFGRVLENVWGPKRFLLFYLACGVGAAFAHLAVQYITWEQMEAAYAAGNLAKAQSYAASLGPALGASGAVMGIFAAFAYLFPNTELFLMFIPFPIKAKWLVLGLAAFDLLGGVAKFSTGIAHFAHLGGAVTGFIIVLIWNKSSRRRFY